MIGDSTRAAGRVAAPHIDTWAQAIPIYRDALLEYHTKRKRDPAAASVKQNIEANTTRIPIRGARLLTLTREMTGSPMAGKRVLDVGCGFGALAAYFMLEGGAMEVVGTDIRTDFLELARRCAESLELGERLRFGEADMQDLSAVDGPGFDLVIAYGVLMYLPSGRALQQAMHEFARMLRPGGHLLAYHNNRWRRTDPYTGDPWLHLLPAPLARVGSRLTGWKHSHGHARLMSPVELRRRARRAGLRDIKIVGFGDERYDRGLRRLRADGYSLSAMRS